MNMRRFVLLAILIPFGIACSTSDDVVTARQLPEALRQDAEEVAQANNQFACDLYALIGDGNAFFSPFSIATALAMLDAGAAGDTDAEIRAALHFTLPGERAHAAYGALLDSLEVGRGFSAYTLATANRLFGQKGFPFLPGYLEVTKETYGAELMPVDFATDPEKARAAVNDWVASQTDDKIPELFRKGEIGSLTILVLANAILFKGDWEKTFDRAMTRSAPFHRADGTSVTAQMMSKEDAIAQTRIEGGRVGVLPFEGKDLAMVVLLPDAADGLPALEAQLSGSALATWIGSAQAADKATTVSLPKFELEKSNELESMLAQLGITSAFDPSRADLSGIDGRRDLHVGHAIHKAVISVDEQGAEAAAATGLSVELSAAPSPFEADRPFAFLIYDQVTGSILFMGRVADPTAS